MIAAVDIETQGLDARKFVLGVLMTDRKRNNTERFFSKRDLWYRILELGHEERRKKRILTVYAHNHQFDFYGYADLEDRNVHFLSTDPFIVNYVVDGRVMIKFLDTFALYRMSAAKMGELVGLKKLDMPDTLRTGQAVERDDLEMDEITTYCEQTHGS